MSQRNRTSTWARTFQRQIVAMTRLAAAAGKHARAKAPQRVAARPGPAPEAGGWTPGVAFGASGARRLRLYRPPGIKPGERLPLMVMLHGCGQDAEGFAASTRMNRVALRERFLVLYPEQDRLANAQGCWNWFDTDSGRAYDEVALIMKAIDQVCLLHPVNGTQVVVAGLSAGASMAALMVTQHPDRFKALVMHSGIPPGTAHSTLSALGAKSVTDFKRAGNTVAALVEVQGLAAHAWSDGADRQPFGDAPGPEASRMAWAFAARQFNALDDACVAPGPRRATAR